MEVEYKKRRKESKLSGEIRLKGKLKYICSCGISVDMEFCVRECDWWVLAKVETVQIHES